MFDPLKQRMPLKLRKLVKRRRALVMGALGSNRYAYPGLNGLDRKVLSYLPENGTFLEVGANDGYAQSNTYCLEKVHSWDGILIEPLPSLFDRCKRTRRRATTFNYACTDIDGDEIEFVDLDLMSVALGQQPAEVEEHRLSGKGKRVAAKVPTARISTLIDRSPYERITFMSIDVEGAELPLLRGIDWKRHTPEWLLIETSGYADVERLLSPHMLLKTQLTPNDYLFHRKG